MRVCVCVYVSASIPVFVSTEFTQCYLAPPGLPSLAPSVWSLWWWEFCLSLSFLCYLWPVLHVTCLLPLLPSPSLGAPFTPLGSDSTEWAACHPQPGCSLSGSPHLGPLGTPSWGSTPSCSHCGSPATGVGAGLIDSILAEGLSQDGSGRVKD